MSSEAQLGSTRGGSGVSNAGTFTWGSNNFTVTTSGVTALRFRPQVPVATIAGTETLTNKTLTTPLTDIIQMTQQSTPANPPAGSNKIYPKSDEKFYVLTSGGIESQLGAGGGGGGISVVFWDGDQAPVRNSFSATFGDLEAYEYNDSSNQFLRVMVRVSDSYAAGSQINLKLAFFTATGSGTMKFTITTYLVRPGTHSILAPAKFSCEYDCGYS